MKIKLEEGFSERFERQLRYIADDSPSRARKFKTETIASVLEMVNPSNKILLYSATIIVRVVR